MLMKRIKKLSRQFLYKINIRDYNEYLTHSKTKKHALLSYLSAPLLPPPSMRDRVMFSNRGLAQEIPRALNELGYLVDIIDYRNLNFYPKKRYDLFIGHCGYNFKNISDILLESVPKICLSMGIYWKKWNKEEGKRIFRAINKYGVVLNPERVSLACEEDSIQLADLIVCLGNNNAAKTFPDIDKVKILNNAAFRPSQIITNRDHKTTKNNYLFFAGWGNVHKGLDLLLEAFKNTNKHLYVCQKVQPQFDYFFQDLLHKQPNIHYIGYVKMRSEKFYKIANQCSWSILPTCAEGQPGSVIETMTYGLIPILPDNANINIEKGCGIKISSLTIGGVNRSIKESENWTSKMCSDATSQIIETYNTFYTPETFRTNFKNILKTFLYN